ncbi:hypothetical protein ACXR2T_07095 [Leucobacter sp. HY1910]
MQHELAVEISRLDPFLEVRLERPVRIAGARPINLDMMLLRDGYRFAVELKYITAKLEETINGEEFLLRAQAAQDLRRYDILKDIGRIEMLCAHNIVESGMSVTITNDRTLWIESTRTGTVDELFRLHHGRTVTGELGWRDHASPGTIRGREATLTLSGAYLLNWLQYSAVDAPRNGDFRMLIAEVK